MSRWLSNTSKDGEFKTLLGNLCLYLVTLTVKKCFLMFRLCFSISVCSETQSVLQFVPIASCPVTGHHWKEPGSTFFTPFNCKECGIPSGIYTVWSYPPEPSLLHAEQSHLSQPSVTGEVLQSLSSPSLSSPQYVHVSPLLRTPELNTSLQV